MRRSMGAAVAVTLSVLFAACGSDDKSSDATSTVPATSAPAVTTTAPQAVTTVPGTTEAPTTTTAPVLPLSPIVKVKLGVAGTLGEAALYMAKDKGYFEAEGLDVELVVMRRFADSLPLLATGDLDFSTGGLNPDVWNAIERDIPVKIVTAHVTGAPGTAQSALLVSQKHFDDGSYKDLSSLKGMKIGINSLGSSSEYYIGKMLAKGGLTVADVELVVLGFADMGAAMANGGIDAAFTVEPFISNMAKAGLGKTVITTTEAVPGSIGSVMVISPVFAEDHPDAAERVLYAFLKAQREYLDAFINGKNPSGRDEIIQILTQHTAVKDPAAFNGMGMSGGDRTGKFDLSSLSDFEEFFISKGSVEKPLDPSEMVDFSYLDYANERLDAEESS